MIVSILFLTSSECLQEKTPALVPESDSESDTPAVPMRPPTLSKSPLEVKETRDTSEDDRPCNNSRAYDPKAADDRTKRKVAVVRPEVRTDPWKESDDRVRAKQLSSDDDMRRKNRSPVKVKPSIPRVQKVSYKRSGSCSDSGSDVDMADRGSRGRRSALGTSDSDRSRILSPKKWSHGHKPLLSAVSASDSEDDGKSGSKAKVVRRRKSNSKRPTEPSDSEDETRPEVKRHTPKPKLRASPIRSASEEEHRKVWVIVNHLCCCVHLTWFKQELLLYIFFSFREDPGEVLYQPDLRTIPVYLKMKSATADPTRCGPANIKNQSLAAGPLHIQSNKLRKKDKHLLVLGGPVDVKRLMSLCLQGTLIALK